MKQTSTNQHWNLLHLCFLLAIILLPLIYVPSLLDKELIPKFILCNALWLMGFAYTLFSKKASTFQANAHFSITGIFLLSYVVWQFLSIIWAPNLGEAVYTSLTGLILFSTYYLGLLFFRQHEKNKHFTYSVVGISSLLLGLYGWYEFFNISNAAVSSSVYEVKGFAGHKNLFVLQLFLHLPFLLLGFIKTKTKLKYVFLAIAILIVLLLINLLARAFMVGFLVTLFLALALYVITRNSEKKTINWKVILLILGLSVGSLAIIIAVQGGTKSLERYNVLKFKKSRNAQERLQLWNNTVQLIQENPLLGHGAGSWPFLYPSKGIHKIKRLADNNLSAARPHNDYLWMGSEIGLVGLFFYFAMLVSIYFIGLKALFKAKDQSTKNALIILISFLTGYLIIAFFDFPRERAELNFLLALLLASLIYQVEKTGTNKKILTLNSTVYKPLNAAILGLLVFSLYVGYSRYQGEFYSKKLLGVYTKAPLNKVGNLIAQAQNPFYTIDPIETPLDFYNCYVHNRDKKMDKAIELAKEAAEVSPYHFNTLTYLATAYGSKNKFTDAIPYYERALQINPEKLPLIEGLAISYYNSGQQEKAKALVKGVNSNNASVKKIQKLN